MGCHTFPKDARPVPHTRSASPGTVALLGLAGAMALLFMEKFLAASLSWSLGLVVEGAASGMAEGVGGGVGGVVERFAAQGAAAAVLVGVLVGNFKVPEAATTVRVEIVDASLMTPHAPS